MDTLRGYSGWGGCADAFSDKPEWRTIRDAIEQALTPEEYTQARASTLTAYYTPGPVVKAMWDALRIGPTPIQVLEPGCGTGNFMAGIPDDVAAHVSGVELDPISARIAAALNPDATILNADLADCTIQQGSFDLAIGNVPYSGDISLDYRTTDGGTSRLPLHDYFIERSVDALRPGGVAMLLTSRYTLDKRSETMRADLARKAELVGVVRLPSSTFARQAGTEAVTDVLVLRRRERTLDHTPDEAWIHSTPIAVPGYQDVTVNVNQAVANDMPTHAVGDIRPVIGRFGGDFDVVFQGDTERIGERLRTLLSMQITHGRPPLQLGEMEPAERAEVIVRPDHVTPFEYSVDQRGVVWYGDGATVTEAAHGQGDEARRLRGMIRLRDLARELQRLELDPAHVDDPAVETKRKELDQAYDRFTGEFGRLNDRANRRAYDSEESGRHLVMALEETDEKGRFVGKAKCLSQRTISPVPPMPDHADSLDDALNISLDRAGRVDLELIARLADTTVEEAEAGLGDRIIRDPYTGTVMPAEDYLTGDVGTKLDRVTAMADRLKRRAGTEAMTEFTASTYATPEDMPATERAGEWISEAGADVWRSLKDPYSAESYRDPAPVIERIAGRNAWTMGWSRNPELVLALAWRAVEELPEQHARVTLERSDTGERKPWHAPAWHQSHGTSPLWDALCWTWRDGDAPQNYAPILAARDMPVTDLALFVHKIAHTDRLDIADKTAILSNLFESWRADDANGRPVWTDTTIGAMARTLMPGTDEPTRLAERLATDMSLSEWIWGIARELPDGLRQAREHNAYGVPPRAIDARPDDYREFRARREEQLGQWRKQPERAEAAHADQADAERLEHVAGLLERVQPTPLEAEQIKAPLGAPWIPARDVHDFMMETFNVHGHGLTPGKLAQYSIDWIPQLGQWRVGYSGGGDIDYKAARTYGTEDRNPFQLLEACLNNAQITVTKDSPTETTPAGKPKRVKDQKATMAAIEKANAIRDTWNQWVFKDPARAQRLTALYNRRFNSMRPRHVDGSYLTTPGIAHGVALRPHQKDAVARALRSDEGTLIAHVVGAGKTFEGVALSHEAKRLGKASKPMLVVPNHLVDQWAGDVLKLYPAGRILVMDKDAQRNPESVRRFWGRVATGDWDAAIVPESRFSQLHVSKERRLRNMRARVDEFAQAVEAAAKARGDKDPTVKRLEAARKSAETAMQRLRDGKESRDDKALAGIEFESLGVDMLIVDEAHHFKNLGVPVASADLGMQLSSAAKCEDLLDKCEWLREAGHGGNIAFMTGTPVSNSMSELYNMQRYLAPGTLKAQGLDTFAAWAGAYGQVVPTVELKPEGNGFQVKQRFARFQNLPELMNAVKQFTDMITNDDIQLPLPELEQVPVPVPITDRQKEEMEELSDRADRVRDGDVPPEIDNLLRITGDGRKIALDPKLLKGHEDDRPLENGKIQACAENVARIWHAAPGNAARLLRLEHARVGRMERLPGPQGPPHPIGRAGRADRVRARRGRQPLQTRAAVRQSPFRRDPRADGKHPEARNRHQRAGTARRDPRPRLPLASRRPGTASRPHPTPGQHVRPRARLPVRDRRHVRRVQLPDRGTQAKVHQPAHELEEPSPRGRGPRRRRGDPRQYQGAGHRRPRHPTPHDIGERDQPAEAPARLMGATEGRHPQGHRPAAPATRRTSAPVDPREDRRQAARLQGPEHPPDRAHERPMGGHDHQRPTGRRPADRMQTPPPGRPPGARRGHDSRIRRPARHRTPRGRHRKDHPGRQGRPRARIRHGDARPLPDRTIQHRQPARPDHQEHGHRPRQAHGPAGGRRKGTRRRTGDAGRTIRPRGRIPAKTGRTRTADVQTRRAPGDGK